MTTANTLRSLVAVASIALATASADAATQALPAALQGKLIYAAPATLSVQSAMTDADTATYDVFIDGRTGFAFVRTPRGWTFVRDIRGDSASGKPKLIN